MGEMQLSSVTDSKKKKTILDQVIVLLCGRQLSLERGISFQGLNQNTLGYLLLCRPVVILLALCLPCLLNSCSQLIVGELKGTVLRWRKNSSQ